jgi:hypothetical protein
MVEMFFAVFVVVNSAGERVGEMRSPEPITKEMCEADLINDAAGLAKILSAHGLTIQLPGSCEPAVVGQPV